MRKMVVPRDTVSHRPCERWFRAGSACFDRLTALSEVEGWHDRHGCLFGRNSEPSIPASPPSV